MLTSGLVQLTISGEGQKPSLIEVLLYREGAMLMRYKREEAFRYAFDPPLEAYFSIIEVNGQTIDVPEGPARLLDLSTHGLKFSSDLDIPMSENDTISVSVRFSINESEYKINGEVAWRKQESKRCFFYGIHLFADERLQQALTQELIVFSRSVNS